MRSLIDPSSLPFIEKSEDHRSLGSSEYSDSEDEPPKKLRKSIQRYILLAVAYIPAIIIYILSISYPQQHCSVTKLLDGKSKASVRFTFLQEQVPAVRDGAVQYEERRWPLHFSRSPYAGKPSPELDLAWHNLFEENNVKVERESLSRLGLTSLPLAGGGYVAQLGVFHELHCIKKIRHWVYKDYYVIPQEPSQDELNEWSAHVDHCIEMLRLSAMCRGDTSLSTFEWLNIGDRKVPTAVDKSPHKCIKWELLTSWVHERAVNLSQPGVLIRD